MNWVPNGVSAEQHALDNPGHTVMVTARLERGVTQVEIVCYYCHPHGDPYWWDAQDAVPSDGEEALKNL